MVNDDGSAPRLGSGQGPRKGRPEPRPADINAALLALFPLTIESPDEFRAMASDLLRMLTIALDEAARGSRDPFRAAVATLAAEQGGPGPLALRAIDKDRRLLRLLWDAAIEVLVGNVMLDLWAEAGPNGGR